MSVGAGSMKRAAAKAEGSEEKTGMIENPAEEVKEALVKMDENAGQKPKKTADHKPAAPKAAVKAESVSSKRKLMKSNREPDTQGTLKAAEFCRLTEELPMYLL